MRSGLAVTALAFALLGAAVAGCGSNEGALVGFTPEGQVSDAVLISDVQPDTRLTIVFTDTLTNAGDTLDTFEFTGDNTFPAGTTFELLRGDGTTPFSDTNGNGFLDSGQLAAGQVELVVLHVTLPGDAAGGPYFADISATSLLDDTHAATAVNSLGEIYPAVRTPQTDSALPGALGAMIAQAPVAVGSGRIELQAMKSGILPAQVDATAGVTFTGQTIADAWPTFSDHLLVMGLVFDKTVANGFRIYANPGDQGFRPAEDFIAAPQANWTTGWSFFAIQLATFDPSVGTDLVGRGAYDGIESGAAPLTEHSFLPIATPTQLTHRENVALISPADSAETDSLPVLTWSPVAGATRYLVEITGRAGITYLALVTGTSHQVQVGTDIIMQNLPLRDGLMYHWVIVAVNDRNRVIGFSHEIRAVAIKTHPESRSAFLQ